MTDWVPEPRLASRATLSRVRVRAGSRYRVGRVKPGMRLLPQRDMAQRLELSVGTISKAYAEAEQRGLISGEVGRGTFVQRRRPEARGLGPSEATINLALNVPPYTGEDDVIASVLADIVADGEMSNLLGYLPHQGLRGHREAMAAWLASLGVTVDADQLFITHGGQHALSIALGMVAAPDDTVLTESYTYSGMLALSAQSRLSPAWRRHGRARTDPGKSRSRLCRDRRARALLHADAANPDRIGDAAGSGGRPSPRSCASTTPTCWRTTPTAICCRRRCRRSRGSFPSAVSSSSASQSAWRRGLRIAAMIAPEAFRDRSINALRATGWMAVPVMAEVVARLIHNGGLARQAKLKRDKAAVRDAIVRRVLKEWLPAATAGAGISYLAAAAGGPHAGGADRAGRTSRHHAGAARSAAADGERKPGVAAVSRRARDRSRPRARADRNPAHP